MPQSIKPMFAVEFLNKLNVLFILLSGIPGTHFYSHLLNTIFIHFTDRLYLKIQLSSQLLQDSDI